jgi:hypothetical protein
LTSGLVIECGDGITRVVPVLDGSILTEAVTTSKVAGRVLTDWLGSLLERDGFKLETDAAPEILRGIKEQLCYVAAASAGPAKADPASYKLPDGSMVTADAARWQCPEALFNPAPPPRPACTDAPSSLADPPCSAGSPTASPPNSRPRPPQEPRSGSPLASYRFSIQPAAMSSGGLVQRRR